ncbi:hypothetical protein SAMN05216357_101403 [Porphyromonadaceae bacterium KH3CP3RA]|nr:hypothetical protein SAMN05216357_101403 [Porphyromonadaceae bacterium KH3CP3RA]
MNKVKSEKLKVNLPTAEKSRTVVRIPSDRIILITLYINN